MTPSSSRPSPALIVAMIALVAGLAGTATALPGKGSVDKNDFAKGAVTKKAIKKGAVTKKAIKKGAVTKKAIKKNAVTKKAIKAAAVTSDKIAAHEAAHVVGATGEPAFGDGGDGDCIWENLSSATPDLSGASPVGFFKDQLGFVHLQGIALAEDGPGGDGVCDYSDPGEIEDGVIFTLPAGYAPSGLFLDFNAASFLFITPTAGATFEGAVLPGGVVFADAGAFLDGVVYEPPAPTAAKGKPARIDLDSLQRLTR